MRLLAGILFVACFLAFLYAVGWSIRAIRRRRARLRGGRWEAGYFVLGGERMVFLAQANRAAAGSEPVARCWYLTRQVHAGEDESVFHEAMADARAEASALNSELVP